MELRHPEPGIYETMDGVWRIRRSIARVAGACSCIVCRTGHRDRCPHDGQATRRGWGVRRSSPPHDYLPGTGPFAFPSLTEALFALTEYEMGLARAIVCDNKGEK